MPWYTLKEWMEGMEAPRGQFQELDQGCQGESHSSNISKVKQSGCILLTRRPKSRGVRLTTARRLPMGIIMKAAIPCHSG